MVDVPLALPPHGSDVKAWDGACAAVRAYCGWHVAPVITETIVLDGSGTSELLLPSLHVVDVLEIIEDGRQVVDPEWSAKGLVRKRGRWTDRYRGVRVTLSHGYDTAPAELLAVIAEASTRGVGSPAIQVGQVRYGGSDGLAGSASFMLDQQAVLDRYRLGPRP